MAILLNSCPPGQLIGLARTALGLCIKGHMREMCLISDLPTPGTYVLFMSPHMKGLPLLCSARVILNHHLGATLTIGHGREG